MSIIHIGIAIIGLFVGYMVSILIVGRKKRNTIRNYMKYFDEHMEKVDVREKQSKSRIIL